MKPGDVLRMRNVRVYDDDGKSYAEYSCGPATKTGKPKREKFEDKEVFVALLLGTEPLKFPPMHDSVYRDRMRMALKEIGWISVDEAITAGADAKKLGFEPKEKK